MESIPFAARSSQWSSAPSAVAATGSPSQLPERTRFTLSLQQPTYENLTCDLCDATASGETFEEWMKALFPHYQEAHPDVMNDPSKTRDDRERWMKENMARFEAAPDDV